MRKKRKTHFLSLSFSLSRPPRSLLLEKKKVIPTAPGDGGYWYAPSSNSTSTSANGGYGERRDEHGKRIDRPRREWRVFLQAGAGVVADSVPEAEYEETVNKAAALGRAVDLAEATFVGVAKEGQ